MYPMDSPIQCARDCGLGATPATAGVGMSMVRDRAMSPALNSRAVIAGCPPSVLGNLRPHCEQ